MAQAAATFQDVLPCGGRLLAPGDARRLLKGIVRHLGLALASVLAVSAVIMTVMFAASWIVRLTLGANPYLQAKASLSVTAAGSADRDPGLMDLVQFADAPAPPRAPIESNAAIGALIFDARLAGATASRFLPRGNDAIALQRPGRSANDGTAPLSPLDAAPEVAERNLGDAPHAARLAALTPATEPAGPGVTPPAQVAPVTANPLRLPRARPANDGPARQSPGDGTPKLAMARPDATADESAPERPETPAPVPYPDSRTAVYDITARTVYMPNGDRLEAHSGFGDKMDDTRYVHVRMRGPTPPNVYDLTLRERLFHGVQAIRLNPVDRRKMFGRDGMLAHTYMLGPNGQSNGCVSFKDYPKFLRAFFRGEVDRLVVVARLGTESWQSVSARNASRRRYADSSR